MRISANNKTFGFTSIAAVVFGLAVHCFGQTAHDASAAGASRELHSAIASRLDAGGDLLVIANVEGEFERFLESVVMSAPDFASDPARAARIKAALAGLDVFLKKNGFYALRGFGLSAVPREDGLNNVKFFLSRDADAAGMPLWQGVFGGKPRQLAGSNFLPSNTVMARVANTGVKQIWELLKDGIRDVAPYKESAFSNLTARAGASLGLGVDKLVDSLGDEWFISVQLSDETTMNIPSAGEMLAIPAPSFLIGLSIKDDTLPKALESRLAGRNIPVTITSAGAAELRSIVLPLPLPLPIQPTYTHYAGFFLLGSAPQVVADAVTAFTEKKGLLSTPEFEKAFAGSAMVNNGIIYISPRFGKLVQDMEKAALSTASGARGGNRAVAALLRSMANQRGAQSCAMTISNLENGVLATGVSSYSGKEIVASTIFAPAALAAAIAAPNFAKARAVSRKNACINNLRRIDAAKEQWAMIQKKAHGDIPTMDDIAQYVGGKKRLRCPAGGAYTINALGADPACSILGHSL